VTTAGRVVGPWSTTTSAIRVPNGKGPASCSHLFLHNGPNAQQQPQQLQRNIWKCYVDRSWAGRGPGIQSSRPWMPVDDVTARFPGTDDVPGPPATRCRWSNKPCRHQLPATVMKTMTMRLQTLSSRTWANL